MIFEIWSSFCI